MFKSRKKKHLNLWYMLNINLLGEKIMRDLKPKKWYRNIPFGHSLLDIFIDDTLATVVSRTFTKGVWVQKEKSVPRANLGWYLQSFHFEKDWANSEKKAPFDKKLVKDISITISEIILDSELENENWIFPFFDNFIVVDIKEDKAGKVYDPPYIHGSVYLCDFDSDSGYGGNFGGNAISTRIDRNGRNLDIPILIDHEMYKTIGLSFKFKNVMNTEYLKI